ncbi:MAG TPA: LemA family protein [Burkholderiaceae bacterium]|nr:LemA family protein [Burkholderiaceae bacterium]
MLSERWMGRERGCVRWQAVVWAALWALLLSGCGYQEIVAQHKRVNDAWGEVVLQYQQRSDLVSQLIQTLAQMPLEPQRALVEQVVAAQAQVAAMVLTPDVNADAKAFAAFNRTQGQLTFALTRLLRAVNAALGAQAPPTYASLVAQLQEVERRIGAARQRYIQSVEQYHALIGAFPNNVTAALAGYKPRVQFTAQLEAARRDAKAQAGKDGETNPEVEIKKQ